MTLKFLALCHQGGLNHSNLFDISRNKRAHNKITANVKYMYPFIDKACALLNHRRNSCFHFKHVFFCEEQSIGSVFFKCLEGKFKLSHGIFAPITLLISQSASLHVFAAAEILLILDR